MNVISLKTLKDFYERHADAEQPLKAWLNEAKKANYSLQDAMELCCARGWIGFNAEWVKDAVSQKSDDKSWMFSNQTIEAKARELGVNDYGIANHQQLKDKILLVMAKKAMQ